MPDHREVNQRRRITDRDRHSQCPGRGLLRHSAGGSSVLRVVPPTPTGSSLQEPPPSRKRGCPLVERHGKLPLQLDGNDVGREPERLDDILGNSDGNIGHNRFHLMNKR